MSDVLTRADSDEFVASQWDDAADLAFESPELGTAGFFPHTEPDAESDT